MTRPNKSFTVRLHTAVVADVTVEAKDHQLAEAMARALWHDQIATASLLGFRIQHNAVHAALAEEALS